MKRIPYILLLSIYLFLNAGISIATHYCGDEIFSVFVETNPTSGEPDDCCGDAGCESCCRTEYTFIKLLDSQKFEAVKNSTSIPAIDLPRYIVQNNRINSSEKTFLPEVKQFPPGSSICIINCTFLI